MALQDGDVVRFDYTLWVDGKVLDTSSEELAKAQGILREGKRYRPLTISLGARQVIPGLESHMRSHGQVGKAVKAEIKAADAYGARDPHRIRDVPMAQFRSQKVAPQVGMELNLGGERGVVTRVAGGRVRVDLNHDLAGKDLAYEYTIREVLTDEPSKLKAVLDNLFSPGSYKVEIGKDEVTLQLPDQVKFDQNWMMAKFTVVAQVRQATGKGKAIRLVETYPVIPDEPQGAAEAAPGDEAGHEGHGHAPGAHAH